MPVHDWKRVKAGIFHDFHHEWISSIKHTLNNGLLPAGYYAMAEQHTAGFEPDVLTLETPAARAHNGHGRGDAGSTAVLTKPRKKPIAETELEAFRRKQKVVAVRHVSDDEIVAMVEIVSPGNKSGRGALRAFIEKAAYLLDKRIHLLILDAFPPTRRDPQGLHGALWEEIADGGYRLPARKPLTLASYECSLTVRAYVEHIAVGDKLPAMSLFLEPGGCIDLPTEETYQRAFAEVPKRWRDVLNAKRSG
jgi:Protein of unknown function (DUF4058)